MYKKMKEQIYRIITATKIAQGISFEDMEQLLQDFTSLSQEFGHDDFHKVLEDVNSSLKEQIKKNDIKVIITPKYKYKIIKEIPAEEKKAADNYYDRILLDRKKNVFKTKFKQWLLKYINTLKDLKTKYTWLEIKPLVLPFTKLKYAATDL
jgi:hypothetical protein